MRSDHGREFENSKFSNLCRSEGIKHEFSTPITPKKNGIIERKNRTLQEMARAMFHSYQTLYSFLDDAVNTVCHIHNRVALRPQSLCIN